MAITVEKSKEILKVVTETYDILHDIEIIEPIDEYAYVVRKKQNMPSGLDNNDIQTESTYVYNIMLKDGKFRNAEWVYEQQMNELVTSYKERDREKEFGEAMKKMGKLINDKAGKSTGGLSSSRNGLREGNRPRHYGDTTHNYGNFFNFRSANEKQIENGTQKVLK